MNGPQELVANALARIESRLAEQGASPRLRPPANPAQIAEVEGSTGLTLPDDLRAAYLIHDGQEYEGSPWLLDGRRWLPVGEIVEKSELAAQGEGDRGGDPGGPIRLVFWSPGWVPIAQAGDGDLLCVDLDPGPAGRVGQVITWSHDGAPVEVLAAGFADALAGIAERLGSGRARYVDEFRSVMTPDEVDRQRRMQARWAAQAEADAVLSPRFTYCVRFSKAELPRELADSLPDHGLTVKRGREAVEYAWLLTGRGTPGLVMELVAAVVRTDLIQAMADDACGQARSLPRLIRLEGEAALTSPWLAWVEEREALMVVRRVIPTSLTFRQDELSGPLREHLAGLNEPPPDPPDSVRYRLRTEGLVTSLELARHPRPSDADEPEEGEGDWFWLDLLSREDNGPWFEWFLSQSARWE